ncbi:DUF5367 family protein [Flagellimonas sp. S174]|uniref:DUF5367 family protein n=1 Tax=Flagellimonas sp. S174 TaxID=3410790 RepID=UPI003BF5927F
MKTLRTISIGTLIWILGVGLYTLSFYVPIMKNAELQANLVLFVMVIPIVWMGCRLYYRNNREAHGLLLGMVFFGISAALDALITVPMLIAPNGGSYQSFFIDIKFWMIGLEFILVALMYWNANINLKAKNI